jgi:hypothetical protein
MNGGGGVSKTTTLTRAATTTQFFLNNLNLIIYSTTCNKIQIFVQDEILSTFFNNDKYTSKRGGL